MTHYASHQENRKKICAPCGKKIVLGNRYVNDFLLSESQASSIKKHFDLQNTDLKSDEFPLSICVTCRLTLAEHDKNVKKRPLPIFPNYQKSLIKNNEICYCYICEKARYRGHSKTTKGAGNVRNNTDCKINDSHFNADDLMIENNLVNNFNENKNDLKKNVKKICTDCFCEIHKGISHLCANPNTRKDIKVEASKNLLNMIETLPEKQQSQIAYAILKNKVKDVPETNIVEVACNTRGRTANIVLKNHSKNKAADFSFESLENFRVKTRSSANHMLKLSNFIRSNVGRKSIPKNYREHMSTQSALLEDLYEVGEFYLDVKANKPKEKRFIVWANAESLVEKTIEKRKLEGNYYIKVMADGGQNFLKICFSIFPENYEKSLEDESGIPEKKRKTYAEGGSLGHESKLTSVNRLLILCIVQNVQESYENMELLFNITKLNDISFKFVADFKLLLIVNGLQTASASFPCPYCMITLNDLRGKNNADPSISSLNNNHATSLVPMETEDDETSDPTSIFLRTYGEIREDYNSFCAKGQQVKNAKFCHSTIHPPLFIESDETLVLEKCILPELHILMGIVNHIFWDGIVSILGEEKALLWAKSLKVVPREFFGGVFEGNDCRKLLQNPDSLTNLEICKDVGSLRLIPFINTLKSLNKIVECCFSVEYHESNLEESIEEFIKNFDSIEISKTLKVHVVQAHLLQALDFLEGRGLGIWSEQPGEAVHHHFLDYWNKYKVKVLDSAEYSIALKKAVIEFSSTHL